MEKRIPVAIVVHLAHADNHNSEGFELTFTDNISAHGACVVSARPWKRGEGADVTSLNDRITLRGRVAYCYQRDDKRYNVGLDFRQREVTWKPYTSPYPSCASTQVEDSSGRAFPRLARTA